MDNKQAGKKDRKGELEMEGVVPLQPVVGGGIRSRKLGDHPPGNPIEDGGGDGYSVSGRKRARRQEGEGNVLKTSVAVAGDDEDGVKVSVQVKPRAQVKPSSEGSSELLDESSKAQLKVEGVNRGWESIFSSVIARRGGEDATRRSEMESSEGAPEAEGAHPCLFIENVLDVVFKHIMDQPRPRKDVAKDVQSIRLVCKTWKASVTRAYRLGGPIAEFVRYDNREDQILYYSNSNNQNPSLRDFMGMMEGCEMIPVQKFKFFGFAFPSGSLALFGDFFRKCGPEVVSLEIRISSVEADTLMQSLRNLPDLNLPKLKTLKLKVEVKYYCQSRDRKQPGLLSLLELLLTTATTLEGFELSYPNPYSMCASHPKAQVVVMQQLGQTIARTLPGTVKQLKLRRMEITEPTFGYLAEAGLKLKLFEFEVPTPSKMGSATLFKFLESQAPTLNAFRLVTPGAELTGRKRNRMELIVQLPVLPELVELWLSDVILGPSTSGPIDLAKHFPKLQHLNLRGMSNEKDLRALLPSAKKPAEYLRILHLPMWPRASLAPFVKIVAQSFPSITELHIVLHKGTRETLEGVFRHFDNLESLHVTLSEILRNANWVDSLFSGTSERDCARIRKTKEFGAVNLRVHPAQPSIHSMTRLRKLVVKESNIGRGRNRHIAFTDFSAHFIFLVMENLREIELPARDVEFSPRYRDLLRDKLVLRD